MSKKPDRYVVLHNHSVYGQTEQGWASYSTKLDGKYSQTAEQMAIYTASRYYGELFADYGDNTLVPLTFRRV